MVTRRCANPDGVLDRAGGSEQPTPGYPVALRLDENRGTLDRRATEVEAEVVTPKRQRRGLAPAREPIDVQAEVVREPTPGLAKGERPKRRVAGGTVERRKLKARPADTAPRRLPSPADRAPSEGTVNIGDEPKRVFFGEPVLDPQGLPAKPTPHGSGSARNLAAHAP